MTGLHNVECTRRFHVCTMHAAHPWARFVLAMLIMLLGGEAKQFLIPSAHIYCDGIKTWLPEAGMFGISLIHWGAV